MLRTTGIHIVPDVPWGTHICQFYQNKKDLIDILVPYCKAGLESNEFCMWITSAPLYKKEIETSMRKVLPDLDDYFMKGQIEIIAHTKWYLRNGIFDPKKVLNSWLDKLENALSAGYDGMRVTGNVSWLRKKYWEKYIDYEQEINNIISKYKLIAICSVPLNTLSQTEVIDVVFRHGYALFKHRGKWSLIQDTQRKKITEELQKSADRLKLIASRGVDFIFQLNTQGNLIYRSPSIERYGYSLEEIIGTDFSDYVLPANLPKAREAFQRTLSGETVELLEFQMLRKDRTPFYTEVNLTPIFEKGVVIGVQGIARDITERKQTEEKLRESEEKYRSIFDNTGTATVIIEEDTTIALINTEGEKLTGYTKEEIEGKKSWTEIMAREELERLKEYHRMRRINPDLVPRNYETILMDKNGDIRNVLVTAGMIPGTKKSIASLLDITERKRVREALLKAERKYRELYENLRDGIVSVDMNGNIIEFNDAFQAMLGYEKDEINKLTYKDITPRKWHHIEENILKEQVFERGYSFLYEKEYIRKDGTISPVELRTYLIKDENGDPTGVWASVRDITKRRKAEKGLKESEEQYRTLVENVNIGIYRNTGGPHGRFIQANPAMAKIFGYDSVQEFMEISASDHYQDTADRERFVEEITKQGFVKNKELKLKKKDGTAIWISVTAQAHFENGDLKWIDGVVEDITDRKHAEKEIKKKVKELEDFYEMAVGRELRIKELKEKVEELEEKFAKLK
ncbi:MAG: PAS domain S-box protein [Nitrospira sp.]|nr:PAS domain S-box protein [Nitrospira sp.]